MAKRLRGFHLEKALQVPKKVPKKTVGSALSTALLSLWCHGKVSGTTMRWLAESALLDVAQHDELVKIAKCVPMGFTLVTYTGISWQPFAKAWTCQPPLNLKKFHAKTPRP